MQFKPNSIKTFLSKYFLLVFCCVMLINFTQFSFDTTTNDLHEIHSHPLTFFSAPIQSQYVWQKKFSNFSKHFCTSRKMFVCLLNVNNFEWDCWEGIATLVLLCDKVRCNNLLEIASLPLFCTFNWHHSNKPQNGSSVLVNFH